MPRARRPQPRYRPMVVDEQAMALALAQVTMIPGIPSKGFARAMAAAARAEAPAITERQADTLRSLVYRYRRQIPADVVALAQGGQ